VSDKATVDALLPAEAPVRPRPPTHLKVEDFGWESVYLTWREPLFRGYMQLTDHVIKITEVLNFSFYANCCRIPFFF